MTRLAAPLAGLLFFALGLGGCADPGSVATQSAACPTSTVAHPDPGRPAPTPGTVWQLNDLDPHAGDLTPGAPVSAVRHAPYPVPGLDDVIAVASTSATYFAVKSDGTVWVWGLDYWGLFGRSTARAYSYTPVQVAGVRNARTIAVVGYTVFVGRSDGTFVGWGGAFAGLLNGGHTGWSPQGQPDITPISQPDSISSIGGAQDTALAVTTDGRVWAWGDDLTQIVSAQPSAGVARISGLENVRAVTGTLFSAFALSADGTVCAWGGNFHGEFGAGAADAKLSSLPGRVPGLPAVVAIAGGHNTVYALDATGGVWAWGAGAGGDLGDGIVAEHDRTRAARINGLPPIVSISATDLATLAVSADGRLFGWGSRFQLPISTGPDSIGVPTAIPVSTRLGQVHGDLGLSAG